MEPKKPFISLVLPAYNEEAIIGNSIDTIMAYLDRKDDLLEYEVLIINDGSKDKTGELADQLAKQYSKLRVIHHPVNLKLGRALQTGFRNSHGEIIIVLDLDLSYSVDHIERLVEKQTETHADVVIASPYMKGGKVTKVPWSRAVMSRVVNRLMRFASGSRFSTFTGMVRAYKADFIKNLNLKTIDYEINPEILYKGIILRAKMVEIPGHLDWSFQKSFGKQRTSGMILTRSFLSGLMSAFILKPYAYFTILGVILLLIALYIIVWIIINTFQILPDIVVETHYFDDRFSHALGIVFRNRPHAFLIGGITLILSIQILSLGFLSLQSKRYFEELFHQNTSNRCKNTQT